MTWAALYLVAALLAALLGRRLADWLSRRWWVRFWEQCRCATEPPTVIPGPFCDALGSVRCSRGAHARVLPGFHFLPIELQRRGCLYCDCDLFRKKDLSR